MKYAIELNPEQLEGLHNLFPGCIVDVMIRQDGSIRILITEDIE